MNFRNTTLLAALALGGAALVASAQGCELVASVDRTQIPSGTGGAGTGGGTSTSTSTSSSSTASSSSSGGAKCMTDKDCTDTPGDCKLPKCNMGTCGSTDEAKGTACTVNNGTVCDGMGMCVAASCMDMLKDGDESDTDCGGSCTPCVDGKKCGKAADCQDKVCDMNGVCAAPTCTDMVQNGTETDKDCGSSCPPCADGLGCMAGTDCTSKVCDAAMKKCSAPTCSDMVQNQDETDKDCGGACAALNPPQKCAYMAGCKAGTDCKGGTCTAGKCAATCTDGSKNQDETDIDCGGAICAKCKPGKACMAPTDCNSGVCTGNVCQVPTCMDMTQNNGETDVDCGGPNCNGCGPGKKCAAGSDCLSNVCLANMTCM